MEKTLESHIVVYGKSSSMNDSCSAHNHMENLEKIKQLEMKGGRVVLPSLVPSWVFLFWEEMLMSLLVQALKSDHMIQILMLPTMRGRQTWYLLMFSVS